MENKTNPWAIILAVVITAVVVGGGVYYWQGQNSTEVAPVEKIAAPEPEKVETAEPEFASLLYDKENYNLPFGAAEIRGYYTTVERPTSLDDSTPDVTCSAFVVTDGPAQLLDALKGDMYGTPPTAVIGSANSYWGNINKSTKENHIKILVTLNPLFEGELIGCMAWPFDSFIEMK